MRNAFLLTFLAAAGAAQGATLLLNGGGGNSRTGDGFSLGVQFTVAAENLRVTALGFYDVTGGALLTDHEIGLWDVTAGNAHVGDATVTATTTNGGTPGFLFVTLGTPIALTRGDQYRLAAYYTPGTSTDHLLDCCQGAAPTADPEFSSLAGTFTPSNTLGSLAEPTGLAGHAYVGPNFQFFQAPEPAMGGLTLAFAALMIGLRSRSRRRI